eukprot:SAG31_NODE_11964_length_981_cov_2.537415_1_plen_171_part_00
MLILSLVAVASAALLPSALTTAAPKTCASTHGGGSSGYSGGWRPAAPTLRPTRKVRFWVGLNGAGGAGIVDRSTNASCSEFFLRNLTKYQASIDSIGVESWKLSSSASGPSLTFNDGSVRDDGLAACMRQVRGYFLVFVQLSEKHGTLIERYTALIEKVSPFIGQEGIQS